MSQSSSSPHLDQISQKVRKRCVEIVHATPGGHIGGALSVTDILVSLFYSELNFKPLDPDWPMRDRFFLSKGHCCIPLYLILSDLGFFPKEWLETYCQSGGHLAGHVEHLIPGVETTSGSLGHGASVAVGHALAAKLKSQNWHTFVILGDGECNEGSNWEAFMAASQHGLNNIHFIIDYNKQESLDHIDNILSLEPLRQKAESFGLDTVEIDGHDLQSLAKYFSNVRSAKKPTMLIAHTIKGKGVSFMEGVYKWHHSKLTQAEFELAMTELSDA